MRKAQVSIFVILGLVLLLIMSVYMFYVSRNSIRSYEEDTDKVTTLSDVNIDSRNYINSCIKDSVQETIDDTGIREENINQYKTIVTEKITECTKELFNNLEDMDYKVEVSNIIIEAVFEDETISVEVIYPISIEHDGQKIDFSSFNYVFDRSTSISIPNGIADKDITIVSSNRNTELKIKKGTRITDKDGNPIENIGIKVEDVHFDGLENMYAVGELVYDNFPDGTYFSEPIEISIEFREEDIPEEYGPENIMISYWNEEVGIWYANPTAIIEGRAVANISHFSKYSLQLLKLHWITNTVFQQRFTPFSASNDDTDAVWFIESGPSGSGVASLQPGYKGIEDLKKHNKYQDFREVLKTEDFLFAPNIRYGFYENPYEEDKGEFTNCEEDKEGDGLNELKCVIDEETYPYCWVFGSTNYFCDSLNSDTECKDKHFGYAVGKDKLCIPYDTTTNEELVSSADQVYGYERMSNHITECSNLKEECPTGTVCSEYETKCQDYIENCNEDESKCNEEKLPCKLITPKLDEDTKVFAWQNYRCAGGDVNQIESLGVADFIEFKKNGNSVVELFRDKPAIVMFASPFNAKPNFDSLKSSLDLQRGNQFTAEQQVARMGVFFDNPTYSFYCQLKKFEDGSTFKRVEATSDLGPAFGINGAYAISKIDSDKTSMQAICEITYAFNGNGYKRSNTPKSLTNDWISPIPILRLWAIEELV